MGALALLAGAAAGLFFFLGGYNVAASAGHWAVVKWLVPIVRDQSIARRAPGTAPALDDAARIRLGAGHFASECAVCHGIPGQPLPANAAAMTPPPPHVSTLAEDRTPEELFWIVRHGIKMTGMPAWLAPAREDEVWSVVAFLQQTGGMTREDYRRLAYGPDWPASDDSVLATCARCHGLDGHGRDMRALPILAGQKPGYLANALRAFRSGERHSGIMQAVATALRNGDIRRLARHYGEARRNPLPPPPTSEMLERGRALARDGSAGRKIPACSACHGPWPEKRNPFFPDLRGQPADYIRTQLHLFKAGERGGSEYRELMRPVARVLTDEDIEAVAAYYASLSPAE